MAYVPSGKVKLGVDALHAQPNRIFTSEDLAKVMSVTRSAVPAYMDSAVRHGLVYRNTKHGALQYAGSPFSDAVAPAPVASAQVVGYVPASMQAPRPGSEQPRRSLATLPPTSSSAPAPAKPQPPAERKCLCPGCSRSICWEKGCMASDVARLIEFSSAPGPTPAPTPSPTPAPIPMPTPAPTIASDVPRFGVRTANVSTEPSTIRPRDSGQRQAEEAAQEFDAWFSVRTGKMRLVGVEIDAEGGVVLTKEQLETLRETAWGKQA